MPAHGSGGDVDCYSFIAVDFHHILLASLPAHSLTLRPAHSRSHQIRDRYPRASDISSPPCLPRLLPAGAVAGWASHPLENAAFHGARGKPSFAQVARMTPLRQEGLNVTFNIFLGNEARTR